MCWAALFTISQPRLRPHTAEGRFVRLLCFDRICSWLVIVLVEKTRFMNMVFARQAWSRKTPSLTLIGECRPLQRQSAAVLCSQTA